MRADNPLKRREYIAAMAMQGILSNQTIHENMQNIAIQNCSSTPEARNFINELTVKLSVEIADHLIRELNKK